MSVEFSPAAGGCNCGCWDYQRLKAENERLWAKIITADAMYRRRLAEIEALERRLASDDQEATP